MTREERAALIETERFRKSGWILGPWTSYQPVLKIDDIFEDYEITSWCKVHKELPVDPIIDALLRAFGLRIDCFDRGDHFGVQMKRYIAMVKSSEACKLEHYSPIVLGHNKSFESVIEKFKKYTRSE